MSDQLLGNLVWKITGDSTNFDKAVANTEKKADGFGGKLKGIGIAAAAAFSVGAIVNFGKKLVGIASDAEETANKFNVVFSTIKGAADTAAANLEKNYGLSGQAAQQLLSDTGDLLTGFGFTQESALGLSEQVNTLAVDLASFTNYSGGAEGASAALTKGLLGEREALKSLGIAITDADIKQLAEDKGIVGELDRQTKASLTLELALKQSKNAIGDFARSQDSFANQSRVTGAALSNLGETLGKKILPFATAGVSMFGRMVTSLDNAISGHSDLSGATDTLIAASKNYDVILKEINETSKTATESEKQLLGARADLAQNAILESLQKLSKEYNKSAKEVGALTAEAQKEEATYKSLLVQRAAMIKMTDEERIATYGGIKTYEGFYKTINEGIQRYETSRKTAAQKADEATAAQKEQIYAIARAYNAGQISIETYKTTNKALYDDIIKATKTVAEYDAAAKKKSATEKAAADAIVKQTEAEKKYKEAREKILGILSEEETEQNKLQKQIEELEKVKWAAGKSEEDRLKAISILKDRIAKLNEEEKKVDEDKNKYYAKAVESVSALSDATLSASGKARKEALDSIAELQKQDGEKKALTDEELARYDELKKKVGEYYDKLDSKEKWNSFVSLANTAVSAVSGLFDALASAITASTDAKLEALDEEEEAALEAAGVAEDTAVETAQAELNAAIEAGDEEEIATAETALKKAQIEADYAKKKEKLEYEGALSAWKLNMLSTTAQSAQAVLNAFNSGIQAGPFAGPILAGVLTALAAATGAASIAAVASAKPTLATGALIPSRPGGVEAIIGEDTTSSGEVVLGLGQQGSPLIEELASRLASKVSSGGGVTNLYLDGKLVAQASANYFNNGQVKLK